MGIIRSTFLIDPDGRIARAWPKVKADGHPAEVLAALGEERPPAPRDDRGGPGTGARRGAARLAPGTVHGDRGPPGRRRFLAGDDRCPVDR